MPDLSPADPDRTAAHVPEPPSTLEATRDESAPGSGHRPAAAPLVIPGYDVLGEIARGGMGRVLAARAWKLDREVAIKVLLPGSDPLAAARRFVRESKITGRLQHPGVPPVHELGELPDGSPFLAMKLVKGRTLTEHLRGRSAPADDLPKFVAIFEKVCEAVGFAHSRGVIHRDLKPANVMVGEFGEVQVMDWGLAKDTASGRVHPGRADVCNDGRGEPGRSPGDDASDATRAGAILGTPAYMAPEQARGEEADARADVFALGAVLFEILTGGRVYGAGPELVILHRAAEGMLADALARLGGCGADAELVALARSCLSAGRADRPADAGAVAGLVAAYRAGVEDRLRKAEAERAAAEVRAAEQQRRRRWQLAAGAAAALLVVGGIGFAWWQDDQARRRHAEDEARAARQQGAEQAAAALNDSALAASLRECEAFLARHDAEGAAVPLAEAERRAAESKADDLRARVEQCRQEVRMLQDLDRADDFMWTVRGDGRYADTGTVAEEWVKAFARFGLHVHTTPPAEFAARVNGAIIKDRLLAALGLWLTWAGHPEIEHILPAADPDPFRNEVRAALKAKNQSALRGLADRPELAEQPAWFSFVLGNEALLTVAQRRRILEAAHRRWRNDFSLLMSLGMLGMEDKTRPDVAIGWRQAALAVRPRNPSALNSLGGLLMNHRKDVVGAEFLFREALRLQPDYPSVHFNLGNVLSAKGELRAAAVAFETAILLNPREVSARHNLGQLRRRRGQLDAAAALFEKALAFDPAHTRSYVALRGVVESALDPAAAVAAYRDWADRDPGSAPRAAALGIALRRAGDAAGAAAALRHALRLEPRLAAARDPELDPRVVTFRDDLLALQRELGDTAGMVETYELSARVDTAAWHELNAVGMALYKKRDLDAAAAAFTAAIRVDDRHPMIHGALGSALADKRDRDGAIRAYTRAAELDPTCAAFRFSLGHLKEAKRDFDGAAAEFREAMRLDPWNPVYPADLAKVLRRKGDLLGAGAAALQSEQIRAARVAPPPHPARR